jgi:hypothetical protein
MRHLRQQPHINKTKYRFFIQWLLLIVHPTKTVNFNSAWSLLSSESLSKCRSDQSRGNLHNTNVILRANNASSTSYTREPHATRKPRCGFLVV